MEFECNTYALTGVCFGELSIMLYACRYSLLKTLETHTHAHTMRCFCWHTNSVICCRPLVGGRWMCFRMCFLGCGVFACACMLKPPVGAWNWHSPKTHTLTFVWMRMCSTHLPGQTKRSSEENPLAVAYCASGLLIHVGFSEWVWVCACVSVTASDFALHTTSEQCCSLNVWRWQ